jgi:hypothetical protein
MIWLAWFTLALEGLVIALGLWMMSASVHALYAILLPLDRLSGASARSPRVQGLRARRLSRLRRLSSRSKDAEVTGRLSYALCPLFGYLGQAPAHPKGPTKVPGSRASPNRSTLTWRPSEEPPP